MSAQETGESGEKIQEALTELRTMIQARWPGARFTISSGEDPEAVYMDAIVDIEDPDEVMDLVVDRLLAMQVEEKVPVHLIALQPLERLTTSSRPYAALEETITGSWHP